MTELSSPESAELMPGMKTGSLEIIFFATEFAVEFPHEKTQINCRKRSMTSAALSCYTKRTGFGLSGDEQASWRAPLKSGTPYEVQHRAAAARRRHPVSGAESNRL